MSKKHCVKIPNFLTTMLWPEGSKEFFACKNSYDVKIALTYEFKSNAGRFCSQTEYLNQFYEKSINWNRSAICYNQVGTTVLSFDNGRVSRSEDISKKEMIIMKFHNFSKSNFSAEQIYRDYLPYCDVVWSKC